MEVFIVKNFKNQYFITDNFYQKPAFISFNNADFLMHNEIHKLDTAACKSEKRYYSEAENMKREFLPDPCAIFLIKE
jgi:hypothetical protein